MNIFQIRNIQQFIDYVKCELHGIKEGFGQTSSDNYDHELPLSQKSRHVKNNVKLQIRFLYYTFTHYPNA